MLQTSLAVVAFLRSTRPLPLLCLFGLLKIGILAAIPDGPETSVNDIEPSKWVFGGRRVFEEFAEAFEGLRELLEARRYQDLKLNGACPGTTLAGSPGWSAE